MKRTRKIDETERAALRECALVCWHNRKALGFSEPQIDRVLIAWMAVGSQAEGEAAAAQLNARRLDAETQANFDHLLGLRPGANGSSPT